MNRTTWRTYIAIFALLTVVALPFGETAVGAVTLLAHLAAIAAFSVAIRRWKPDTRAPWQYARVGTTLFAVGAIVRVLFGETSQPMLWLANAIDVSAYLAVAFTTFGFAQQRSHDRDPTNLLDAVLGVLGMFSLAWAYIMTPYLTSSSVSTSAKAVESLFVAASFIVGFSVARLAIGPGARNASYYMLAGATAGIVVLEAVISTQLGHSGSGEPSVLVPTLITCVALVSFGACALHPSMVQMTAPSDEPVGVMSKWRLVILLSSVLTPGIVLVATSDTSRLMQWPIIGGWLLTGLVVVTRMSGLLKARERAGEIDFMISRTTAGLVAVTEHDELTRTAAVGILQIIDAHPSSRVMVLDGLDIHAFGTEFDGRQTKQRDDVISLDVASALSGRTPVHLFDTALPDGSTARSALVVPLVSRDHRHGTVVVSELIRVIPHQERDGIIRICADLALALETATIADAMHRARSERRFRSLVDNAAEIIAVVDENHDITFASPAVTRVLGYAEVDLLGTPFDLLLGPSYRDQFGALLAGVVDSISEVQLVSADEQPRWFDLIVGDLRNEPEIKGFVVTARDVTERKNAAIVLEGREARFRALVQNSADGIALVGENGRISWVTPTLLNMLDTTEATIVDTRFELLIMEADRESYSDLVRRARANSRTPVTSELHFTTGISEERVVEVTISDQRDELAVGAFVVNLHDVTARKRLEDDLRHQALHDALTGLPNRVLFNDRVAQALRQQRTGDTAVLLLDLDDFQTINDAVGHSVGDDVLKLVARRIDQLLRDGDTVARLGGDEFAIIVDVGDQRDTAYNVGQRILVELASTASWTGVDITLNGSIGVVFASDCETPTAEIMLRNADMALYAAKRSGKGILATYTEDMHQLAAERLTLKSDLEHAVQLDQLELHYQAIVDLRDQSVRGFEALMRWNHPERGLISPATFIPIAEETGVIVGMGRWLMDTAFAQTAQWNATRSPDDRPLRISVNLSPRQLEDANIAADIRDALKRHGLESKLVTIEITESSAVERDTVRHQRISEIAALGVGIAADDFGTGYASYAALSNLPFTGVKIDRSLVSGLTNNKSDRTTAQVQAILSMADISNLSVVAEGIETEGEMNELRALGCILGQGFFLHRPVNVASATILAIPTAVI